MTVNVKINNYLKWVIFMRHFEAINEGNNDALTKIKRSECCIIQISTKGSQKYLRRIYLRGILNLIKRCINYRRYLYYNVLCEKINRFKASLVKN